MTSGGVGRHCSFTVNEVNSTYIATVVHSADGQTLSVEFSNNVPIVKYAKIKLKSEMYKM